MPIEIGSLLVKLQADTSGLKTGMNEANAEFAKANKGVSLLADAFKQLGIKSQSELNATARAAQEAFAVISKSGQTSARDVQAAFEASSKATQAAIRGTAVEADKAAQTHRSIFEGLGSSVQSLAAGLIAAGAAMTAAVTAPVAAVVTLGVEFNALKERAQIAFTGILGSGERAMAFLGELAAFAAKTPFEFPELVKAAQRFTAIGIEAKAVIPIMTSLGDAVAAFGGTSVEIERVSVQLTQMLGKGKVNMADLRVIAESIPASVQIMASKLGITVGEMFDKMEKGSLKAADGVKALLLGLTEKFQGQMEAQSRTFSGLMSTLKDQVRFAAADITQGLFDKLKGGLELLVDLLPKVITLFRGLPPEILAAGAAIVGVTAVVGPLMVAVGGLIALLGGPLTAAMVGVGVAVAALAAVVVLNWDHISKATASWVGGTGISLSQVVLFVGATADAFAALSRVLVLAYDAMISHTVAFAQAIIGVFKGLKDSVGSIFVGMVTGNFTQAALGFQKLGEGVSEGVGRAIGTLKGLASRTIESFDSISAHANGKFVAQFGLAFMKAKATTDSWKADYNKFTDEINAAFNKLGEQAGKAGDSSKKGADAAKAALRESAKDIEEFMKATGASVKITGKELDELLKKSPEAAKQLVLAAKSFSGIKEAIEKINFERALAGLAPLSDSLKIVGKNVEIPINTLEALRKKFPEVAEALEKLKFSFKQTFPDISGVVIDHSLAMKGPLTAVTGWIVGLGAAFRITVPTMFASLKATEDGVKKWSEGIEKAFETVTEAAPHWAGAVVDAATKMEEAIRGSAEVIRAEAALNIRDSIEGTIDTFARLGAAANKHGSELVKFVQEKMSTLPAAVKEAGAKILKEWADSLIRLPGIWDDAVNKILDGIGKFDASARANIKGFFADVFGLLDALPGKWGSSINKVINEIERWMNFLDKAIRVIERVLGDDSPGGLGDILGGVVGIFKKTGGEIKKSTDGVAGAAAGAAKAGGAATEGLAKDVEKHTGSISSAFSKASGAIAGFTTGLVTSSATGSKAAGALSGALTGALSGFATGGPVGAIIGGIGGLLGGLFGGKSAHQKAMERLEEEKLAAEVGRIKEDVKKAMQETIQAAIQTMQDALKLFDELPGFAEIPKALIKAFFKNLRQVLDMFAELAGSFSQDMLAKVKAFTENIGPAIQIIGDGVAAFDSLAGFLGTPQVAVTAFGTALERVLNVLEEVVSNVEKRTIKLARRLAEKVIESITVIKDGVEAFEKLAALKEVPEAAFDAFGQGLLVALNKMFEISATVDGFILKQSAKMATQMSSIVSLISSAVETLTGLKDLQNVPGEAFEALRVGLQSAVETFQKVANTIDAEIIARAAAIAERVSTIVELMKALPEAFDAFRNYKPISEFIFRAVMQDFDAFASMIEALLERAMRMKGNVEAFRDAVLSIREMLGESLGGVGINFGGGRGGDPYAPRSPIDTTPDRPTFPVLTPPGYSDVLASSYTSTSSQSVDKSIHIGSITIPSGPQADALRDILGRIVSGGQRAAEAM